MKRRDASLALVLGTFSFFAEAQAPAGNVRRIGYLSQPGRESVEPVLQVFLRALRDLGWADGGNLVIEYRCAEGNVERLPDLAAELVRSNVELIVAPAAPQEHWA